MPHKIQAVRHDIITAIDEISGFLAHGYDRVDYTVLWDAATKELESLRQHAESIFP